AATMSLEAAGDIRALEVRAKIPTGRGEAGGISKGLLTLLMFGLLNMAVVQPCIAKLNQRYKDGGVCVAGMSGGAALASGASAATVIGAPVAGAIALGAGGFQAGFFGVGAVWSLFDPPDTLNACVPVSLSTYLVYRYPNMRTLEPSCD